MRTTTSSNGSLGHRIPAVLALAAALVSASVTRASELKVAWASSSDAEIAGYHMYIGENAGQYDRTIDVGRVLSTTVDGLQDERLYYITVKAYNRAGQESTAVSPTLECFAHPRVESVSPATIASGQATYVTLTGVNFDRTSQVRSLDKRLRVRSVVPGTSGRLTLLVEAASTRGATETISLEGAFSPVPGCRKADEFFKAHPEMADVDGNGLVDRADLDTVRDAFGARKGDATYVDAADLDGDGSVDGRDMARVVERLGFEAETRAPMESALRASAVAR